MRVASASNCLPWYFSPGPRPHSLDQSVYQCISVSPGYGSKILKCAIHQGAETTKYIYIYIYVYNYTYIYIYIYLFIIIYIYNYIYIIIYIYTKCAAPWVSPYPFLHHMINRNCSSASWPTKNSGGATVGKGFLTRIPIFKLFVGWITSPAPSKSRWIPDSQWTGEFSQRLSAPSPTMATAFFNRSCCKMLTARLCLALRHGKRGGTSNARMFRSRPLRFSRWRTELTVYQHMLGTAGYQALESLVYDQKTQKCW